MAVLGRFCRARAAIPRSCSVVPSRFLHPAATAVLSRTAAAVLGRTAAAVLGRSARACWATVAGSSDPDSWVRHIRRGSIRSEPAGRAPLHPSGGRHPELPLPARRATTAIFEHPTPRV